MSTTNLVVFPGSPLRWYALHVRSSQERIVTAQLEYAGLEAFYPHYVERSRDGRRNVERKFFPGYVFVSADLQRWNSDSIPQVVGIVGLGPRHPLAIPAGEIEAVRRLADSPLACISAPCAFLEQGDLARITRGAFTGLEGFVVRAGRKAHVVVSVQALNQSRSIEVDLHDVERVAPLRKAA